MNTDKNHNLSTEEFINAVPPLFFRYSLRCWSENVLKGAIMATILGSTAMLFPVFTVQVSP
jgi:hypothetical protein